MKKFSEFMDKLTLFKKSKKPKLKIIKGKDGKKGLKINGKLTLAVEYDNIHVSNHHILFEQYGVARWASVEDLEERYTPASNNCFNLVRFKKMRCKHCKSKLKVTYDDLKMHYNTVDIVTSYYFECPYCKERLELSLKKGKKLKNNS